VVAWISYAIVTGLVVAGLATVLEAFPPVRRRAGRWLWAGALVATFALPVLLPALRPPTVDGPAWVALGPGAVAGVTDAAAGAAGSTPWTIEWDSLVLLGWGLATGVLLSLLAVRAWVLSRHQRDWPETWVEGTPVRLSHARGPAVMGAWSPVIVVPEWLLGLPRSDQELVLAHERSHAEARDSLLMCAAWILAACIPWSPAAWYQVARLRRSMEADCDRRVLQGRPWSEARRYGELVIEFGARAPARAPWAAPAGFASRQPPLERRIRSMYDLYPPLSRIRRMIAWSGVAALAVALFALPRPATLFSPATVGDGPVADAPQPQPVVDDAPEIAASPTFTPYSVAPNLLNREAVARALEEAYPPLLRDAGIGGTARVWFFIDADGSVQDTRIDESSGHQEIDRAALSVASMMQFSPALNRDQPVPVWVAFPITFQTR
jgi:TonB family protein